MEILMRNRQVKNGKLRCKRCFQWLDPDKFHDRTRGTGGKRWICAECENKLNAYRNHHDRHKKPYTPHRVNFRERIEKIYQMDKQAQELLSCMDRKGLLDLAKRMKEFNMPKRAHELELAAG
jgi:hypothetical protein